MNDESLNNIVENEQDAKLLITYITNFAKTEIMQRKCSINWG